MITATCVKVNEVFTLFNEYESERFLPSTDNSVGLR